MTAQITLRLRDGDTYIVVSPSEGDEFEICVTDAIGRDAAGEEKRAALEHLLLTLSGLREQVYNMLGRRPPRR